MNGRPIPIATDPLGAIRMELVGAARRRTAVRERRQRVTSVAAAALATLVVVAGAGAVLDVETGVPEIDDLLGTLASRHQAADEAAPRVNGPTTRDLRPGSADSSEPLELPWGDGSRNAVAAAFVNQAGDICLALTEPHGEGVSEARGGLGCLRSEALSQRLADDVLFISSATYGETTVLSGFAAADVVAVEVDGPEGPLDTQLTRPWSPDAPGAGALRVFTASTPPGEGAPSGDDGGDPRDHVVRAWLRDGRIVELRP